jgi:hypothetical protein
VSGPSADPKRLAALAGKEPDREFIIYNGNGHPYLLRLEWDDLITDPAIDGTPCGYVYEWTVWESGQERQVTLLIEHGNEKEWHAGFDSTVPLSQWARAQPCDADGEPIV